MSDAQDPTLHQIGFLLVPDFALLTFAAATEPLRAANLLAGRELYRLSIYSPDGQPVLSSSGVPVPAAPLPRDGGALKTVFVLAGGEVTSWVYPGVLGALRRLAKAQVRLGGISGGAYLLAQAGLMTGRRYTTHWEYAPALLEAFPDTDLQRARYVLDGNRITCGGGIAVLDMMVALIAERLGRDFARRVSDWFLHTHLDRPAGSQRASTAERYGSHHPVLLSVLEKMESTIEAPLSRQALAGFSGVSPRHLDRLFAQQLGTTFLAAYRRIRLEHARQLLQQSALSISEIAFATGFSSSGHFSRCFRQDFHQTPRQARKG
jgi:transcriptional regulator GlxA family with amidase domain|tara:strand:+ start:1036 stop:1995 length:960 start_codon:yes stop_codon:yes gene_type:complete